MKPQSNIQSLRDWQRQTLERELLAGWTVELGEASKLWTLYTPSRHAFAAGSFMEIMGRIVEINRI